MLIKLGEALQISSTSSENDDFENFIDFKPASSFKLDAENLYGNILAENKAIAIKKLAFLQNAASDKVDEELGKFATALKTIAPKANDFLYFTAIMMHAAEAALRNEDGSIKKDAKGNEITARWDEGPNGSLKWVCSDPSINFYKNNNADAFPRHELLKAYKKWVGKPLCLDHKSASVDMIRGVIVDTYYDHNHDRVIALCALDKKNYPDLARKVTSRYASCVSMGVGVGRAICSDCGKVASIEPDFCEHMRNRNRYAEINCDLNPIELSIVVNGADPKAKIRRIVAKANSIAEYVSAQELEFTGLKSVIAEDKEKDSKIEKVMENLSKVMEELSALKDSLKDLGEKKEDSELEEDIKDSDSEKVEKTASDHSVNSLDAISEKLDKISHKVSELLNSKDPSMTNSKKAYFQGGGGVNEPTPGQVKYPKEDSDKIRNTDDKQMQGQKPFPSTGPVDGIHPGYASFNESEEDRKKRLKRAEEMEARSIRRAAALKGIKTAYLTEKGELDKTVYPKDDAEKIRNNDDKQMQGQKPFPGVGDVKGLHPSPESAEEKDELKRKEMLRRAALKARFTKAANVGDSVWQVLADGKLVLTASVDELSGGRSEVLYDAFATQEFGKKLLASVREHGVEKIASTLSKKAQMAPAPLPMPVMPEVKPEETLPVGPSTTVAEPLPVEAPKAEDLSKADTLEDAGGSGDPKEKLPELLDEAETIQAEMRKGVEALTSTDSNELDQLEDADLSPKVAANINLQKQMRNVLVSGMKQAVKELSSEVEALKLAHEIYTGGSALSADQAKTVADITNEEVARTKKTLAGANKLMVVFSKYALAHEATIKKANLEMKLKKEAQDPTAGVVGKVYHEGDPFMPLDAVPGVPYAPKKDAPKAAPAPAAKPVAKEKLPSEKTVDELMRERGDRSGVENMLINVSRKDVAPGGSHDTSNACDTDEEKDMNDMKMLPDGSLEGSADEMAKVVDKKAEDLSTEEARAAFRAKLAKETGVQFSKMLDEAHKKDDTTPKSLNQNKPSMDLGKVETLSEVHDAMVAACTPKQKKTAEQIQKLVIAGEIAANQVESLIAEGVDAAAVAYWKKMWGQVKDPDSKEFASNLVKEHYEAKLAEELKKLEVKMARSWDLVDEMVRRGAIDDNTASKSAQVKEYMCLNDVGFEQMAKTIRTLPVKQAGYSVPRVGLVNSAAELVIPETKNSSLADEYSALFSNSKFR